MSRSRNFGFAGVLFLLFTSSLALPMPAEPNQAQTVGDEAVPTYLISETKCQACESLLGKIDHVLSDKNLQERLVGMLEDDICMRIPQEGQTKCNETFAKMIPTVMDNLAAHVLDPTTDCKDIGFCEKDAQIVTETNTENLKCNLCNEAVGFLADHVLESEKATEFLTGEFTKVCALLPSDYVQMCNGAANATVPQMLVYIGQFLEQHGCIDIGFCNQEQLGTENREMIWDEFRKFLKAFQREYEDTAEYMMRFMTYLENYNFVKENSKDGLRLELNEFADQSPIEFAEYRHDTCIIGYRNHEDGLNGCKAFEPSEIVLPGEVDWTKQGVVTPVKNQGQCGSCWSFSATGSMEGSYAIASGNLTSFSEQELVDCSTPYGNMGCNGGLMDEAFRFAIDNGMCTEDEEPYEARDDKCVQCEAKARFTDCVDVTTENEAHLMQAVAKRPVSVAIEADNQVFMFYKGGIIASEACGENLDHGVLVVGYGEENGQKYWLVKNSWGTGWGENGYVRIARDETKTGAGICGIAIQPSYIEV